MFVLCSENNRRIHCLLRRALAEPSCSQNSNQPPQPSPSKGKFHSTDWAGCVLNLQNKPCCQLKPSSMLSLESDFLIVIKIITNRCLVFSIARSLRHSGEIYLRKNCASSKLEKTLFKVNYFRIIIPNYLSLRLQTSCLKL